MFKPSDLKTLRRLKKFVLGRNGHRKYQLEKRKRALQ